MKTGWIALMLVTGMTSAIPGTVSAGVFSTYYRNEVPIGNLIAVGRPDGDTTTETAPAGWFYEIANETNDDYVLRFDHRSEAHRYYVGDESKDATFADRYFRIKKADLTDDRLKQLFVQGIDPGVMAVPFKYRPKAPGATSQLAGDASVGAALGLRFATDLLTTTLEPMVCFATSQVALGDSTSAAPRSTQALTLAAGVQVDIWERLSLGLAVGWDRVPGKDGKSWVYQGRPWYALSLNAGVLNRKSAGSQAKSPETGSEAGIK